MVNLQGRPPFAQVEKPAIVVFDTDCVLCSGMVAFVLKWEHDHSIRFAGAWSEAGRELGARHGFSQEDLHKTFLLVRDDSALTKSEAAFALAGYLRAPWRWLRVFKIVPKGIADRLYDVIAKNRYRWFGYRKDCVVVPQAQRDRFLGT